MTIFAWRRWNLFQDSNLMSLGGYPPRGFYTRWEPCQIKEAVCARDYFDKSKIPDHEYATVPAVGCTCGLYASRFPTEQVDDPAPRLVSWRVPGPVLRRYVDFGWASLPPRVVLHVFGVVELWGKVIPGARGYRAQFGRVAALVGDSITVVESASPAPDHIAQFTECYFALPDLYKVPLLPDVEYAAREFSLEVK